jgi:hypothetical protein
MESPDVAKRHPEKEKGLQILQPFFASAFETVRSN